MRVICLALLLLAPALASARQLLDDGDFHFAQCAASPVFNVSGVSISPNPAVHGQDIYVTLTGSNAREVTAARLTVSIYYRGWPVQRQTRDICGGPRPVTPPCPFEPGNLTITSSDAVPLLAPVGPYSMRMQAWDQGGDGVMCVDLWFRVAAAAAGGSNGGSSGALSSGGRVGADGSGSDGGDSSSSTSSSGGGRGHGGSADHLWRQRALEPRQMRTGPRPQQSDRAPFTAAT